MKRLTLFGWMLLACVMSARPVYAVSLSQVPLFVSSGVEPNVMFILDDSGSMRWAYMPDELASTPNFGSTGGCGWRGCSSGTYAGFSSMSYRHLTNQNYLASSHVNQQYYNPDITYAPPPRGDGTYFPNSNFNDAWVDGYAQSGSKIDLATNYRAIINDAAGTGIARFTISHNADAGQAFYFRFVDSAQCRADPYSDSCHQRVNVGAAERQNFANWFSYYRTRLMSSKAGIAFAFDQQSDAMRLGYGAINAGSSSVDGSDTRTIIRGVRPFRDEPGQNRNFRTQFFDWLHGATASGGTPLRRALDDAGKYYQRTGDRGPWSTTPGVSGGENFECRQSYTVLMTDGYWNGDPAGGATGNVDNTAGPTHQAPDGRTYQYRPGPPFQDVYENTLADVAMYYWKNDLQPDMANRVPHTSFNPAFWQHMVTYGVGLGVSGTIDPETAWEAFENRTAITWPDPHSTADPRFKLDDLLHAAINSRGGFFSAQDPETFSAELSGVLRNIIDRGNSSSAAIATNSTRLDGESYVYQARFNSGDWSGDLVAFRINRDGSVSNNPRWSAAQNLDERTVEQRRVLTLNSETGEQVRFDWNEISAAQRTALGGDGQGQKVLSYVLGYHGDELRNGGTFRNRESRLADIVNSDPAYTGRETFGYQAVSGAEGTSYPEFIFNKRQRDPMIYVGSNGGMLHGLDANTGVERFAYVPSFLIPELPRLTDPEYTHRYFVDGSPTVTDAYINGEWRTVLVGTPGAGGRGMFALDVSDPDNPSVLWEVGPGHPAYQYMGEGMDEVSLVRTMVGTGGNRESRWVVVAGNGYNSPTHQSALIILNAETGALEAALSTGQGSLSTRNGMAPVVAVSSSDDVRTADTIYGGDLLGNLWKFTQNNQGQWRIDSNRPVFRAVRGTTPQPITAKPEVGMNDSGDMMIFIGTGKYLESVDTETSGGIQSLYGIIDNANNTITRGDLRQQSIIIETEVDGQGVRIVSDNELGNRRGWYVDLDTVMHERSVVRPLLRGDLILFVTLIPSSDPCSTGGTSWLMVLDVENGGRVDGGAIDLDGDGIIDLQDYVQGLPISGMREDNIMTRLTPQTGFGGTDTIIGSDSSGGMPQYNIRGIDDDLGRQSWRQVR